MHVTNLIIGAGPTGLGAAHRLRELGQNDFLVVERNPYVGGLSASFKDEAGFTWDIGGHVVFSHYEYYDKLLDELLGENVHVHQRIARVRMAGDWVPYPFQNNIRYLPRELAFECVQGLLPGHKREDPPESFADWFEYVFGAGIARLFMRPYNYKVWATPPELMSYSWIGERVSVIDVERVLKNLILQEDDVSWGPNNTFRFPDTGGTGEIYSRMAGGFPDRIRLNTPVTGLNLRTRTATLGGEGGQGITVTFENCLNTTPLDKLVLEVIDAPDTALREAAGNLAHNSVYVAGVGVEGTREDETCWMYFPESDCPYYRLTNFHNYSPKNVPSPGKQRGLMAETSFSAHKVEDLDRLMDATVDGLVSTAMLLPGETAGIVSRFAYTADYGYPVPTLTRDPALALIQPWLEQHGVCSRGRFGGWRYEVANMDHSVMQGVEWADRVTSQAEESTYRIPK